MVDPDTSIILAPLYPQNKSANSNGLRRLRSAKPLEQVVAELAQAQTPPYLQKLLNDYAATGLPQSYIPKDEIGEQE